MWLAMTGVTNRWWWQVVVYLAGEERRCWQSKQRMSAMKGNSKSVKFLWWIRPIKRMDLCWRMYVCAHAHAQYIPLHSSVCSCVGVLAYELATLKCCICTVSIYQHFYLLWMGKRENSNICGRMGVLGALGNGWMDG